MLPSGTRCVKDKEHWQLALIYELSGKPRGSCAREGSQWYPRRIYRKIAPVADAQAKLRRIKALKLFDIASIGFQKPRQRLEQP